MKRLPPGGGVFLTAGYDVIAPFIREQAARITWGEPIIEAARSYLALPWAI